MYHLLTNCSQSILPAMVCRLSLFVLNTSLLAKDYERIMLCNPMKALLTQGCLNQCSFMTRDGGQPMIGWKDFCGIWLCSHFYREMISVGTTECKGSDTT